VRRGDARRARRARDYGSFVRLDMESSAYTQTTLDLFYDRLRPAYPENVGIVLQSYLYRTDDDAARAASEQVRVRSARARTRSRPTSPTRQEGRRRGVRARHAAAHARRPLPGLATHDPAIIDEAKRFAAAEGIGRDRFEFQMLYGVRRDLQEQLVADGYRMRVYVPFGTSWYPYLMRRLAERPANLMFMTGSVVKEALGGRARTAPGARGAGPEAFGVGRERGRDGGTDWERRRPSNGAARAGAGADVAGRVRTSDSAGSPWARTTPSTARRTSTPATSRPSAATPRCTGARPPSRRRRLLVQRRDERRRDRRAGRGAWGGYFLFLRWRRLGAQGVEGHLESDFVTRAQPRSPPSTRFGRVPCAWPRPRSTPSCANSPAARRRAAGGPVAAEADDHDDA
jgi:hypothetical protein